MVSQKDSEWVKALGEVKMGSNPPDKKSPVGDLEEVYDRALARKVYLQTLGMQPGREQSQTPRVEEKYGFDLGAIFTAQSNQIVSLIGQIKDMTSTQPQGENPLMAHLLKDLEDMKATLQAQPDSLDALLSNKAKLDQLAQSFKANVGLAGVAVGGQDLSAMLQLQQMKEEHDERLQLWQKDAEERRHRWETDLEERRQQWKREDARWAEEFRLKKMQYFDERERREKSGGILENLAGALIEGIDEERGVAGQPKPQSFPCEVCRTPVPVPQGATEGQQVQCPKCEETYTLAAKDKA